MDGTDVSRDFLSLSGFMETHVYIHTHEHTHAHTQTHTNMHTNTLLVT